MTTARRRRGQRVVRGIVVDPQGKPVADALVHVNFGSARTRRDGSFELTTAVPGFYVGAPNLIVDQLHVLARDFAFAIVPNAIAASRRKRLRVVLNDSMTFVWGTVVDHAGKPVKGANVGLEEGTYFGGLPSPNDGVFSTRFEDVWLDGWYCFPTDAHGKFSYPAFLGRSYDVHVVATEPLRHAVQRRVLGGATKLVLQLPGGRTSTIARVRGVVRTRDGKPVPGITVSPRLEIPLLPRLSTAVTQLETFGTRIQTDARGRFELRDVPKAWLTLAVYGDGYRFSHQRFAPTPKSMEIVVERLCPILVRSRSRRTSFVVRPAGDFMMFRDRDPSGRERSSTGMLVVGRRGSPERVRWLPESVKALHVERWDGSRETRIPIRLDPGRVIDVEV